MTIEQAHPEDIKAFDAYFFKQPNIIKKLHNIDAYERTGRYAQALREKQLLDEIRRKSFEIFIKDYASTVRKVDLKDLNLPIDIREKINALYIAIYMACDFIESGVVDINDMLHSVDKRLTVESFNDLTKLAESVKSKLRFLERTDGYMNMDSWGERCDMLYGLIKDHASSIVKEKRKKDGQILK